MTERLLVSPGAPVQPLKAGEKNYLRLSKGERYRVVQPGANDATRNEPVEAIREGQNLTIRYPDGTELVVPDYYDTCAGGSCNLALGDGSRLGYVLSPDVPTAWAGPVVMYSVAVPVVVA